MPTILMPWWCCALSFSSLFFSHTPLGFWHLKTDHISHPTSHMMHGLNREEIELSWESKLLWTLELWPPNTFSFCTQVISWWKEINMDSYMLNKRGCGPLIRIKKLMQKGGAWHPKFGWASSWFMHMKRESFNFIELLLSRLIQINLNSNQF